MNRRVLTGGSVASVVVAALALLFVGLRAARIASYQVLCKHNLRQLGYASLAYA